MGSIASAHQPQIGSFPSGFECNIKVTVQLSLAK